MCEQLSLNRLVFAVRRIRLGVVYVWPTCRDSYLIVQCVSPRMLTLLHDSFRLNINIWGTFLKGCRNFAFDTHIYQAWVSDANSESVSVTVLRHFQEILIVAMLLCLGLID